MIALQVLVQLLSGTTESWKRGLGLLKHRVLHYSLSVASRIFNACVILHNMCIENNIPNVPLEPEDENVDFGMYQPEDGDFVVEHGARWVNPELAEARLLQQRIIRNFFNV